MDIECIFNKIYNYYNKTDENLKNMSIDLEKLNNTHLFYIKSINEENANTYINSNNFHYSVYIDDIFYQKKILTMEYECMLNINNFNIDKFYRDLYKLYLKIIKLLVNVIHENNKLVTKINDIDNIKNNVESIEDIRKKFLSDIKIYKESDSINQKFNYDDIKKIFNAINKRNTNINEYIKDIHKHILIVDKKVNKGMLIETFKISFNGNIESLVLEYNLYIKIFESIITNHYNISKKYYIRTKNISDEITFDEDSNKTTDNSSESTPNNKNKNINNIIDTDNNSNADSNSNADNNNDIIDINHEFKISFNTN